MSINKSANPADIIYGQDSFFIMKENILPLSKKEIARIDTEVGKRVICREKKKGSGFS